MSYSTSGESANNARNDAAPHAWLESISDRQVDQGRFSGGREISESEKLAQGNPFIASIRIYELRSM
jgi:hypothetical protein